MSTGSSTRRMERLSSRGLAWLAERWPDPMAAKNQRLNAEVGASAYDDAYALEQFMGRVWFGAGVGRELPPLWGKVVVEIGCGHGGISCWLASMGAREVIGIDVNEKSLAFAERLADHIASRSGQPRLPVRFKLMDCSAMSFESESIDVVVADNLFEHVDEPLAVMRNVHRVLRPGGVLVVPTFSSIYSKYGAHLKHGLRLPWLSLLPERVVVDALRVRAERHPELYDVYPGLREGPHSIKDVRRHRDLNSITHARFLALAAEAGFDVKSFWVHGTRAGRALQRVIPRLKESRVLDVLSTGAGAVLRKS